MGEATPERAERAEEYFRRAYEAQMRGDLDQAVALYRKSIEAVPTAEAHTFLGWTYSFRGDYEAAIRECCVAIGVDPDFGNPYNDIGSYLIKLGRHADAIPWLRKAMAARRYEPRHYPHVNLARVYARQGKLHDAIAELRRALDLEPDYQPARAELHRLIGQLN
ncbi:MAG TPA: tetratricopeptide repeat protein [Methylomirabilota bacterium]|jgi:Tfp pilus assembly protein PilF|nr:tetratricopeptide repeat protein [Methylomirabilota bacterium]